MQITFTHEGKTYTGELQSVHGAAGNTWHLMINKFYYGRLCLFGGKMVFQGNKLGEKFEGLANLFTGHIKGTAGGSPDRRSSDL